MTQRYTILNCFTQETLYKEEEEGPILSTSGILTNDSKASYAFHNDLTIVWKRDEAESQPCISHSIHDGIGLAITHNEETRLVDKGNQIEFHYRQEEQRLCLLSPVYAVIGLHDTYIQIKKLKHTKRIRSIEEETTVTEDEGYSDDLQEQRKNHLIPTRLINALELTPGRCSCNLWMERRKNLL